MSDNVLLCIDLEDESSWRKALPTAVDHARHTGAQLHVLTVVPDNMIRMTVVAQVLPQGFEEKLVKDAQDRLAVLVREHCPDDLEVRQAVRHGSVYKEILRFARDIGADLIIMASHKPELKDYLLGPNAAQIVRHSDCSVWVVRDRA